MKKLFLLLVVITLACQVHGKRYPYVVFETNFGNIKLKLYEDTPVHRENFLLLVKEGYYDGMVFHRVIENFMIQGGNSELRKEISGKKKKRSKLKYNPADTTWPAEIIPGHYHVKGALAAARLSDQINPEKRSSAEQFYIVQGKKFTDEELNGMEISRLNKLKDRYASDLIKKQGTELRLLMENKQSVEANKILNKIYQETEEEFRNYEGHLIPSEIKEVYRNEGGSPHLDGEYTVFGEVVEGIEIVDKIAAQPTGRGDKPKEEIVILKAYTKRK